MNFYYHRRALENLNLQPEVDPAAVELMAQRERALGFPFPEAMRELYTLKQAKQLLAGLDNEVVPLSELGNDYRPELGLIRILSDREGYYTLFVHLDGQPDPIVRMLGDNAEDVDEQGIPLTVEGTFSQVVNQQTEFVVEYERQARENYRKWAAEQEAMTLPKRIWRALKSTLAIGKRGRV